MERMIKEELKKELEKLKDFKLYVFEGDIYVKAEDYKEKAIENKKLKHKNELQEKALIRLCLKHHYDSIIIEGEEVIDMSNYTVVENKKPKEEKLF